MLNFFKKKKNNKLYAPVDGKMISIDKVSDEMFSQKIMGDGVAFILDGNRVFPPCDGKLSALFPTGHAFGITRDDGVEILVHIGINTVELNGKGFNILPHAKLDSRVTVDMPIVELDMDELNNTDYDLTTMLVVTNSNGLEIKFNEEGNVERGDAITQ